MPVSSVNMSSCGNGESLVEKRVRLYFHRYRYFPYEKELARMEVERLATNCRITDATGGIEVVGPVDLDRLRRLTYVAVIQSGDLSLRTVQHELENPGRNNDTASSRQSTRYSAHGLHEYKGRFNPQLVSFLLNYLGADSSTRVLDPFCGSGTTLVESAIHRIKSIGVDMNPLAVFMSNAKLEALALQADQIREALHHVLVSFETLHDQEQLVLFDSDDRQRYLSYWFRPGTLLVIEALRKSIIEKAGSARAILLLLVSDLLREYSLQEPADLRIRRRMSPEPTRALVDVFKESASRFITGLAAAQRVTGSINVDSKAFVGDSRNSGQIIDILGHEEADLVITSPPYSTALPYIDIQRLSLVWLQLCSVASIRKLEGEAVGSRERRAKEPEWAQRIKQNADQLPESVIKLCRDLEASLGDQDGFRRRAMPTLVYRYFTDMKKAFLALSGAIKKNGRLAFVIGSNHTTIGGTRFEIETGRLLGAVALSCGFRELERIDLQTYHRYELHRKNSIRREDLTIFERC